MVNRFVLSLVSLVSASVIACPGAADLDKGIRLHYDDDTWSVYRRENPTSIVESNFSGSARLDYVFHLTHGVLETRYIEMNERGTRPSDITRYTYDFDPALLTSPTAGQLVKGKQTLIYEDGEQETIAFQIRVQEQVDFNIGKCSYPALPVVSRYDYAHGKEWVVTLYLPSVGIAFSVENKTNDGVEKYRPVKIEAVK